jgi:hypothetical protein
MECAAAEATSTLPTPSRRAASVRKFHFFEFFPNPAAPSFSAISDETGDGRGFHLSHDLSALNLDDDLARGESLAT